MKAECPNGCEQEEFITTAHVVQTWQVEKDGEFITEISCCDEVTHKPSADNIWTCAQCGAEATVTE